MREQTRIARNTRHNGKRLFRLTHKEVTEIYTWCRLGFSTRQVAKIYGTSQSQTCRIAGERTWHKVDKRIYFRKEF